MPYKRCVVALATLLTLAFGVDSDACFRLRSRCSAPTVSCNPCGVPSWVRCHPAHTLTMRADTRGTCPPPSDPLATVCWCCPVGGGAPEPCSDTNPCPVTSTICNRPGPGGIPIRPPIICPSRIGHEKTAGCACTSTTGVQCSCAMICDEHTHCLRFAYPCEFSGHGYAYYPIGFLGTKCLRPGEHATTAEPPLHE
jgi:hypothetical protein